MTEFEKEVLNYLIDIRDRLEILLSDESMYLEDFQQYVVSKCIHSFNSPLCYRCRFKRMCKKYYKNEEE